MSAEKRIKVSEVFYREDLYPRGKSDSDKIREYAENLEVLPPIEVNQHNILIDGFHRWTAHRKNEAETITVVVTTTASEAELFELAIERNSKHGQILTDVDKRRNAVYLYQLGRAKEHIAERLSVSLRTVNNYLSETDQQIKKERKAKIFEMYLACRTQEEIATALKIGRKTVDDVLAELETMPKPPKVLFSEEGFEPPTTNLWGYDANLDEPACFVGITPEKIIDNLLYAYTEPFDIVLDPFAGGGATIDVCKRRMRRYYVSDRKPIVERENEIRLLDIVTDLPQLNKRWSDVALTYLQPSLNDSAETVANVINRIAEKQSKGVIAVWIPALLKEQTDINFFRVLEKTNLKKLQINMRIFCGFSPEIYSDAERQEAKETKKFLNVYQDLVVLEIKK